MTSKPNVLDICMKPGLMTKQKCHRTAWQILRIKQYIKLKFIWLFCGTLCIKELNREFLLLPLPQKKRSFPLRISSVNVTKSAVSFGFDHIYWRNSWRKISLFVQKSLGVTIQILWLFIVSLLKNANIIKKSLDKPCIYLLVDYIRCYYGSNF